MDEDKENTAIASGNTMGMEAGAEDDAIEFVQSQLLALNHKIKSAELTPKVIQCLKQLLLERHALRQSCESLVTDCTTMQGNLQQAARDHSFLEHQITLLKLDVGNSVSQMASAQHELREAKARFAAEKTDLEQRCFQLQALETQHQAGLRKFEKDFSKLQDQLLKQIRSAEKGKGASVQISAPLSSLRPVRSENVASIKESQHISALRLQNAALQKELEGLRRLLGAIVEDFDALNARADDIEKQLTKEPPAQSSAEEEGVPPSPMVDLSDPRDKPLEWLRQHLEANMLKLRKRILSHAQDEEGVEPSAPLALTLSGMKSRLEMTESLVIAQDKLMRAAIMCKAPITPFTRNRRHAEETPVHRCMRMDKEMERDAEEEEQCLIYERRRLMFTESKTPETSTRAAPQVDDFSPSPSLSATEMLQNMMPPVTPGTRKLLLDAGIFPLPREVDDAGST